MHCKRSEAGCDAAPTETDDLQAQAIVLRRVLGAFPERLTIPGLVSELTKGEPTFAESDTYERAVRDLTGVGLLRCPCGLVEPTRIALYVYALPEA